MSVAVFSLTGLNNVSEQGSGIRGPAVYVGIQLHSRAYSMHAPTMSFSIEHRAIASWCVFMCII
jgi:hypothetical protein